jgi:hypothetical protein
MTPSAIPNGRARLAVEQHGAVWCPLISEPAQLDLDVDAARGYANRLQIPFVRPELLRVIESKRSLQRWLRHLSRVVHVVGTWASGGYILCWASCPYFTREL